MSSKRSLKGISRTDAFLFDPEELILVTDEAHILFAPEVNLPFDEDLVRNIMVNGVIEPVIVSMNNEVIDGRQRVKAAREANRRLAKEGKQLVRTPAMRRRSASDADMFGVLVSSNEHRRKDSAIEQAAKALKMLNMGAKEEEICIAFGWKPSSLKAMLKLLDCDPKVKSAVSSGQVSATAAARLAGLGRKEQRNALEKLLKESNGKRATVRQAQRAVSGKKEIKPPKKKEIEALMAKQYANDSARAFVAGAGWARGHLSDNQCQALLNLVRSDEA